MNTSVIDIKPELVIEPSLMNPPSLMFISPELMIEPSFWILTRLVVLCILISPALVSVPVFFKLTSSGIIRVSVEPIVRDDTVHWLTPFHVPPNVETHVVASTVPPMACASWVENVDNVKIKTANMEK